MNLYINTLGSCLFKHVYYVIYFLISKFINFPKMYYIQNHIYCVIYLFEPILGLKKKKIKMCLLYSCDIKYFYLFFSIICVLHKYL